MRHTETNPQIYLILDTNIILLTYEIEQFRKRI